MGTLQAPPRQELLVVSNMVGNLHVDGQKPQKARAWLLDDKRLIVSTSPDGETLERNEYLVAAVQLEQMSGKFTLEDGTVLTLRLKDCNCGMGVVGSAQPVDGRYKITRVRTPEWVEVDE